MPVWQFANLLLCFRPFAECDVNPDVFQHIGDLSEKPMNGLETTREQSVNAIFDGILIPEVMDEDDIANLTNPLDASLALFEPCGIPGKVEIDKSAKSLKV